MEYRKEFIALVNSLKNEDDKNLRFVGLGNPNSKILIISKECSFDLGKEQDRFFYKLENQDNLQQWIYNIENPIDQDTLPCWENNPDLYNPLFPFKGQLNKINRNNNGGTSQTWLQYQKLVDKILKKDPVDEEEYVKQITKMFIYDFYSLDDKSAKTDVGGTDFIYQASLENFLENAEDTYYKYVESNIYGDRKQELPVVDEIKIESVEETEFAYGETSDENAYEVQVSWTYTDDAFSDYQKEATLTFIHEDIKLSLAELK